MTLKLLDGLFQLGIYAATIEMFARSSLKQHSQFGWLIHCNWMDN